MASKLSRATAACRPDCQAASARPLASPAASPRSKVARRYFRVSQATRQRTTTMRRRYAGVALMYTRPATPGRVFVPPPRPRCVVLARRAHIASTDRPASRAATVLGHAERSAGGRVHRREGARPHRDHPGARPGSGRGPREGPGLRCVPHRPALPRGRHQRRVPVPARARGGRARRGGGGGRHQRRSRRLRDPRLAGAVRHVPLVSPRPALVLLRLAQRPAEDDPRRPGRCRRPWASGPSPRRPSWRRASACPSTPGPSRRPPGSSAVA